MSQEIPTSVADFQTSLSAQVVAGDTSLTLTSIVDFDGNNLPAGLYAFTLDGNIEEYKEYVIGTLAGSVLSNIMSVSVQGLETPGIAKYHRRGALVSMTDWVVLGKVVNTLRGTQGLDPASPLFYDSAPASLSGNQIPTVDYVLSVVNGGPVSFQQQVFTSQTAGENLTALNHVYFKESDQRWYKVDADDTATFQQLKRGIALSTQTTGGSLSIATSGVVSGFVGLVAGSKYYASNTAGNIQTTVGTNTVFVGVALSTTQLIFDVNFRDIPYGNQKDALEGSSGTPSTTNPYVTLTDGRIGVLKSVTAGETISGATVPVPVYQNSTDNQYYSCDGNDTAKLKFQGFAVSDGTDNNPINLQTSGIVSGFSALDEGVSYWLSDSVGQIQNTPGTYPVLVGIGISTTELLIQKGRRTFAGNGGDVGSASGSLVVTCGFRPNVIRIAGMYASVSTTSQLDFVWWNGNIASTANFLDDVGNSAVVDNTARLYYTSTGAYMTFSITTVTATGFTIVWTETGSVGGGFFSYSAEGEI